MTTRRAARRRPRRPRRLPPQWQTRIIDGTFNALTAKIAALQAQLAAARFCQRCGQHIEAAREGSEAIMSHTTQ